MATTSRKSDEAPANSSDAHRSFCDVLEQEIDAVTSHGQQTEPGSTRVAAPPQPSYGAAAGGAAASTTIEPNTQTSADTFKAAAASVRRGLVGRNAPFRTPYGSKPLVYSDWTATGRAVRSIERYLEEEVLPLFGNTHTTTSITGAQTTCYRHEARQIIAQAVNAKVCGAWKKAQRGLRTPSAVDSQSVTCLRFVTGIVALVATGFGEC